VRNPKGFGKADKIATALCDRTGFQGSEMVKATSAVLALLLLLAIPRFALADFMAAEAAFRRGDHPEAYEACKKEVDAGDAECQVLVGYLFQEGLGVPANATEALRLYHLAAKRGLAVAQCHLGYVYERGIGVTRNDAEAVRWYQLAAAQGDPICEYDLAFALIDGQGGIAKDRTRAIELLKDAADRGYAPAQIELAFQLERAPGAMRQAVRAYMWYLVAARLTSNSKLKARATQGQNRLIIEFSSAAIIAARSAAADWNPVGPRLEFGPLGARPVLPRDQTANSSASPKPVSSGSGFFVSHQGDLITNNHLIEGCRELRIVSDEKSNVARVIGTDVGADLAILRVADRPGDIASFRASNVEKPGEAVTVAGYPLQGLLTSKASVTTGIISALAGPKEDKKLIQITAPVQPGNSGGPLVDNQGNIIGVIVSKLNGLRVARVIGSLPENINFAVRADLAREFLDKYSIKYETAPPKTEPLATPEIAEKVFKFTAMIQCYK
jgi:S1-C subfamily serine protease